MALGRTTRLQAINVSLLDSQLSPVESVASGDPDAEIAEITLDEVHVEVLTRGWHWNTLVMVFNPDVNGNILLAETTLKADAIDRCKDVSLTGDKLFDKTNNTFVFKEPIELRIAIVREWEELPQSARRYIEKKTSRIFQQRILGDQGLNQNILQEEQIAWSQMIKEDVSMKDYNHIKAGRNSSRIVSRRQAWTR